MSEATSEAREPSSIQAHRRRLQSPRRYAESADWGLAVGQNEPQSGITEGYAFT